MKTSLNRSLPFIILAFGVGTSLGLAKLRQDPPRSSSEEGALLVETATADRCDDGFKIRVDGEVIPFREISLAAEVGGRVSRKSARAMAGTFVHRDELLFEIDDRDYRLQVEQLRKTVDQASSSIEEADVEQENVKRLIELAEDELESQRKEVARYDELWAKKATSASQLDAVRRTEIRARNALQTLRNQSLLLDARRNRLAQEKERALTNLDQALLNLERTQIRSPIDGIVVRDMVEADDYVQPGAPLVQLEDTSKVEVRFSLRLDQLSWIWQTAGARQPTNANANASASDSYRLPQLPVKVNMEVDGSLYTWSGRLTRYDGSGIDSVTRTSPCIATVEEPTAGRLVSAGDGPAFGPPPRLLRGMFVSIEIPVAASANLVRIPAAAVRPGKRVWLVEDGSLVVRGVQVAHADDVSVLVLADTSQIQDGAQVVTSPLPLAVEGMAVRLAGAGNELRRNLAQRGDSPAN